MNAVQIVGLAVALFCGYGVVLGLIHQDTPRHYMLIWITGTLLGIWLVVR